MTGKLTPNWRAFGFPLVVRTNIANGSDIHETYEKLLTPFLEQAEDSSDNHDGLDETTTEEILEINDTRDTRSSGLPETSDKEESNGQSDTGFQFYLTDEKGTEKFSEIAADEPLEPAPKTARLNVLVSWSERMVKRYNVKPFDSLPEVFKSGFYTKKTQETVSLYKCLEAFLKEEPLGPDDMW